MNADYPQIQWDEQLEEDCLEIVRLAVREDLGRTYDWTTVALVPEQAWGEADVVARREGVLAGLPAARLALREFDARLTLSAALDEGTRLRVGQTLARIEGPVRSLLTAERVVLNLLGRLSGIATLTRQYADRVAGTHARIYDTRKTTPGWRRLEKYAVRIGGGYNHRLGLCDAVLIKDNHLAWGQAAQGESGYRPAEAVRRARELTSHFLSATAAERLVVEIEVDTLEQLDEVLPAGPDIVLLDNMPLETLREAVARRNAAYPGIVLEASGGVNLDTISAVAATGVDRISIGAITHAAQWLDIGLDWKPPASGR